MMAFFRFHRHVHLIVWGLLIGVIFPVCFETGSYAQDLPYRILVTNDDGIDSEGIQALAKELKKIAEVLVVAPLENKSGSSQSIRMDGRKLRCKPHYKDGKIFGYSVNGPPAVAVIFGIFELCKGQKVDLVVSGINPGTNVGIAAHFSGTVGAAMTALLYGVPSVAVSQSHRTPDFNFAARFTAKIVDKIKKHGALPGVVLSINIPSGMKKGVVIAPKGGSIIKIEGFEKNEDEAGNPYFKAKRKIMYDQKEGTDTIAYRDKFITITPLSSDWTDYNALKKLGKWHFDLN